jgi:MoaA/NifB/PqqE/SkfB family radical SAM enzyme
MIAGVELYNETLVSPGYIEDRGYYWNQERGDDYLPSLKSGLQVQWTYSKLCNFSCVHCFNGSGPDWRGFEADPFRVAENLISALPYNVCLCGGEPFTWSPIYDIVEKLRAGGIPLVSTVSNGWIATPDRLQKLCDAGLTHLQISVDGYHNEEFVELRLKEDGLAKATAAVEAAVHMDWQDLSVSFTPTKRNIGSWKEYCRFWADKGITHIRTQPFMPIGRGKESLDLKPTDEQYLQFQLDTQEMTRELAGVFVDWGDPLEHIWFYTATPAHPWAYGIQTDGWFELSSYVPVLVGSALDHPVEEFWAKDAKKLWNAPIVRRFASQLANSVGMSQLDVEIYKEHSLHIDIFDDEQLEIFLTSDDLDQLRQISERNIAAHLERHGA